MTFIIHADTPEEFRSALLSWLQQKHQDAAARAKQPHQSLHVRHAWIVRTQVIEEAAAFIQKLQIEPKPATGGEP